MSVLINLSTRQISLSSSRVEFLLYPFSQFFFFFVPHDLSFGSRVNSGELKLSAFVFKFSILFFFTSCLLLQTTGFSIKLNPLCCFTRFWCLFSFFI